MLPLDYNIEATDEELEVAESNGPCVISEGAATLIRSSPSLALCVVDRKSRAPVLPTVTGKESQHH